MANECDTDNYLINCNPKLDSETETGGVSKSAERFKLRARQNPAKLGKAQRRFAGPVGGEFVNFPPAKAILQKISNIASRSS